MQNRSGMKSKTSQGCGCGGQSAHGSTRTSAGRCGCANCSGHSDARPASGTCSEGCFERPAYYPGQILTHSDLMADQNYQNAKRRLLNRSLHGHGVVCGLDVTQAATRSPILHISPGLALDPDGNEIYVDQDLTVDLTAALRACANRTSGPCRDMPGASPTGAYASLAGNTSMIANPAALMAAFRQVKSMDELYSLAFQALGSFVAIAVRYQEYEAEPQPAFLPQTGCEAPCAYSRIHEGYCLEVLCGSELDEGALRQLFWADVVEPRFTQTCPEGCCAQGSSPYVFLAVATMIRGQIHVVPNVRRRVWSFPRLFQSMAPMAGPLPELLLEAVCQRLQMRTTHHTALHSQPGAEPAEIGLDFSALIASLPDMLESHVHERVAALVEPVRQAATPVRQMAMAAFHATKMPLYQQPAYAALVHSTAESIAVADLGDVTPEDRQRLATRGYTTLAAVLNDPAGVHSELGEEGGKLLRAAEARFKDLTAGATKAATTVGMVNEEAVHTHKVALTKALRVNEAVLSRSAEILRGFRP